MTIDLATLPWLPPRPADFSRRCRALSGADGASLRALATHALGTDSLLTLARWSREIADPRPLHPLRVMILGNGTLDFIAPALAATAPRHGVRCEVLTVPYGTAVQQALDPESTLARERPDVVVLAFDHRGLPIEDGAEAALDFLLGLRDSIVASSGATAFLQTVAQTPEATFGSLDLQVEETLRARIDAFNRALLARAKAGPNPVLDVAGIAAAVGIVRWHDPVQWNLAKLPFSQEMVPLYADHVARLLAALVGRVRKCLVFDLDNTLWGGVIGDDGLDGIRISEGDAVGEAFRSVQRMAARFRARGIVLAVCSKNEDENARLPFRLHPDMLLREDQFACFMANWDDKATNLEAIASAIGIGTDALVFVDDNPAERALVRDALPEVAVPELPADPAYYSRMIESAGYFEAIAFTDVDRRRADQYVDNARRTELRSKARDLGEYLRALEMVLRVKPFDAPGRARIAQLINKSNQFNLTTRRYSEREVSAFADDPSVFTLQAQLVDRFGDNGMISVVICRDREDGQTWMIDTWIMSCRVLGRGVESAILNEVAHAALAAGKTELVGEFVPSGRNELVRNHYRDLGFRHVADGAAGAEAWSLDLVGFADRQVHMRIERDPTPRPFAASSVSSDEPAETCLDVHASNAL
jgi:FkbH-like protein